MGAISETKMNSKKPPPLMRYYRHIESIGDLISISFKDFLTNTINHGGDYMRKFFNPIILSVITLLNIIWFIVIISLKDLSLREKLLIIAPAFLGGTAYIKSYKDFM